MLEVAIIAALVVCSGFYSGSEMGLYALNRVRLRFRARRGDETATILYGLRQDLAFTITVIVLGNNLVNYFASALCTHLLSRTAGLERWADFYSMLVLTPILLVFGEVVPKSVFHMRADRLMYGCAWPLSISRILLYPAARVLSWANHMFQSFFGPVTTEAATLTEERIRSLLSAGASGGALSPYQERLAKNVLSIKSRALTHALVPMDEIVMASSDDSTDRLLELHRQHRYSRIPVCTPDRKRIVGIVNILDLAPQEGLRDRSISELAREPVQLDANLSIAQGLYELQRAGQQMGVVMRRDGTAAGIVTVKDLVEQIVGELEAW